MKLINLLLTGILVMFFRTQAAQLILDTITRTGSHPPVCFNIALPDNYAAMSAPCPVVYHLHGIGGSQGGAQNTTVPAAFEAARQKGLIGPVIIVFPNGYNNSFWADAINADKPAESDIVDLIIPYIDSTYHTIKNRAGRVIEGFSMGGFGAAKFMTKYPELFCACVIYDGALLTWQEIQTRHADVCSTIFNDDSAYFVQFSPWARLSSNIQNIGSSYPVSMTVGALLAPNRNFRDSLISKGIQPEYVETGCAHELGCLLDAEGEDNIARLGQILGTAAKISIPQKEFHGDALGPAGSKKADIIYNLLGRRSPGIASPRIVNQPQMKNLKIHCQASRKVQ